MSGSEDQPVSMALVRGESVRKTLESALERCDQLDAVMIVGLTRVPGGACSFGVSWSQLSYLERIGILNEAIWQVQESCVVD